MVFVAFVLLTVSLLAVHGSVLSIDGLVIPERCKNTTFCEEKPIGYPQEEIDHFLMQGNVMQLQRMKRETGPMEIPEIKPGSITGNCETIREMKTPYIIKKEGQVPQVIVQSQFFVQELPSVTCKRHYADGEGPDLQCFSDFVREGSGIKTKCIQKTIKTKLYVYTKDKQIEVVDGEIDVDCTCTKI